MGMEKKVSTTSTRQHGINLPCLLACLVASHCEPFNRRLRPRPMHKAGRCAQLISDKRPCLSSLYLSRGALTMTDHKDLAFQPTMESLQSFQFELRL